MRPLLPNPYMLLTLVACGTLHNLVFYSLSYYHTNIKAWESILGLQFLFSKVVSRSYISIFQVEFEYQWWEVRDFPHPWFRHLTNHWCVLLRARIELPWAPTNTVFTILSWTILSSQNGRARSSHFQVFSIWDDWSVKWRHNGRSVELSAHHLDPCLVRQYIVWTTPDVNLLITKLPSSFSFFFYQSNHRSDVRSSAMIFQLEPTIGPGSFKEPVSCFDRTQYWR